MKDLTSIYTNNEISRYIDPEVYLLGGGIEIGEGDDLKSEKFMVPGNYFCKGNSIVPTLINCPAGIMEAFVLKASWANGDDVNKKYLRQTFITFSSMIIISRLYDGYGNAWSGDIKFYNSVTPNSIDISDQIIISPLLETGSGYRLLIEYFPVSREVSIFFNSNDGNTAINNTQGMFTFNDKKYLPKKTGIDLWGIGSASSEPLSNVAGEYLKYNNLYSMSIRCVDDYLCAYFPLNQKFYNLRFNIRYTCN